MLALSESPDICCEAVVTEVVEVAAALLAAAGTFCSTITAWGVAWCGKVFALGPTGHTYELREKLTLVRMAQNISVFSTIFNAC